MNTHVNLLPDAGDQAVVEVDPNLPVAWVAVDDNNRFVIDSFPTAGVSHFGVGCLGRISGGHDRDFEWMARMLAPDGYTDAHVWVWPNFDFVIVYTGQAAA
jgi:hypothetical protein